MVPIGAPFVATLNITNECNLACHYCYSRRTPALSMPTATALQLIDDLLGAHGIFYLMIAGGEPLLHPGICEIVSCSFAKYPRRVQLLTNGIRLCEDRFFSDFREVCLDLSERGTPLEIQVSLDSVIPTVHEVHRQASHLTLEAIDRLLALPVRLQLACVVTSANVAVADGLIDHYYPRVRNFHFMNLIFPNGVRCSWPGLHSASDQDTAALDARLQDKEGRYANLKVNRLVPVPPGSCRGMMEGRGCLAGITRIDVEANLDVKACCMADSPMGNLAQQPFEEVWRSEAAERLRACDYALCAPFAMR